MPTPYANGGYLFFSVVSLLTHPIEQSLPPNLDGIPGLQSLETDLTCVSNALRPRRDVAAARNPLQVQNTHAHAQNGIWSNSCLPFPPSFLPRSVGWRHSAQRFRGEEGDAWVGRLLSGQAEEEGGEEGVSDRAQTGNPMLSKTTTPPLRQRRRRRRSWCSPSPVSYTQYVL